MVGPVADVTCPPYDVIDDAERAELRAASPYNLVRVLLAEPGDERYQSAAADLERWMAEGALVRDDSPRFYLYAIDYTDLAGASRQARGIMGALAVRPLGDEVVPHEETMEKVHSDRLAILTATRANLDIIAALSDATELSALVEPPPGRARLDFEAGGVRHRLYDITDPERVAAIAAAAASRPISIADGHHRYITALRYLEEHGPGPGWDSIMCFLSPLERGGLSIAPTHRVFLAATVDRDCLEESFEVSESEARVPAQAGELTLVGRTGAGPLLLRPRPEALATLAGPLQAAGSAVANRLLWPCLGVTEADAAYVSDADAALDAIVPGGAAVLLAPLTNEAIGAAGEAGIRFPAKTTFFYPKPRSGLVIRTWD